MEEFDIYEDLEIQHEQEKQKIEEDLKWKDKYEVALITIQKLQAEKKELNKKIKHLEINFASLFETARTEIKRKDNQISELRKQKDDICFRRVKPQANWKQFDENAEVMYRQQVSENIRVNPFSCEPRKVNHSNSDKLEQFLEDKLQDKLRATSSKEPIENEKRKSDKTSHLEQASSYGSRSRDRSREKRRDSSEERSNHRNKKSRRREDDRSRHHSDERNDAKHRSRLRDRQSDKSKDRSSRRDDQYNDKKKRKHDRDTSRTRSSDSSRDRYEQINSSSHRFSHTIEKQNKTTSNRHESERLEEKPRGTHKSSSDPKRDHRLSHTIERQGKTSSNRHEPEKLEENPKDTNKTSSDPKRDQSDDTQVKGNKLQRVPSPISKHQANSKIEILQIEILKDVKELKKKNKLEEKTPKPDPIDPSKVANEKANQLLEALFDDALMNRFDEPSCDLYDDLQVSSKQIDTIPDERKEEKINTKFQTPQKESATKLIDDLFGPSPAGSVHEVVKSMSLKNPIGEVSGDSDFVPIMKLDNSHTDKLNQCVLLEEIVSDDGQHSPKIKPLSRPLTTSSPYGKTEKQTDSSNDENKVAKIDVNSNLKRQQQNSMPSIDKSSSDHDVSDEVVTSSEVPIVIDGDAPDDVLSNDEVKDNKEPEISSSIESNMPENIETNREPFKFPEFDSSFYSSDDEEINDTDIKENKNVSRAEIESPAFEKLTPLRNVEKHVTESISTSNDSNNAAGEDDSKEISNILPKTDEIVPEPNCAHFINEENPTEKCTEIASKSRSTEVKHEHRSSFSENNKQSTSSQISSENSKEMDKVYSKGHSKKSSYSSKHNRTSHNSGSSSRAEDNQQGSRSSRKYKEKHHNSHHDYHEYQDDFEHHRHLKHKHRTKESTHVRSDSTSQKHSKKDNRHSSKQEKRETKSHCSKDETESLFSKNNILEDRSSPMLLYYEDEPVKDNCDNQKIADEDQVFFLHCDDISDDDEIIGNDDYDDDAKNNTKYDEKNLSQNVIETEVNKTEINQHTGDELQEDRERVKSIETTSSGIKEGSIENVEEISKKVESFEKNSTEINFELVESANGEHVVESIAEQNKTEIIHKSNKKSDKVFEINENVTDKLKKVSKLTVENNSTEVCTEPGISTNTNNVVEQDKPEIIKEPIEESYITEVNTKTKNVELDVLEDTSKIECNTTVIDRIDYNDQSISMETVVDRKSIVLSEEMSESHGLIQTYTSNATMEPLNVDNWNAVCDFVELHKTNPTICDEISKINKSTLDTNIYASGGISHSNDVAVLKSQQFSEDHEDNTEKQDSFKNKLSTELENNENLLVETEYSNASNFREFVSNGNEDRTNENLERTKGIDVPTNDNLEQIRSLNLAEENFKYQERHDFIDSLHSSSHHIECNKSITFSDTSSEQSEGEETDLCIPNGDEMLNDFRSSHNCDDISSNNEETREKIMKLFSDEKLEPSLDDITNSADCHLFITEPQSGEHMSLNEQHHETASSDVPFPNLNISPDSSPTETFVNIETNGKEEISSQVSKSLSICPSNNVESSPEIGRSVLNSTKLVSKLESFPKLLNLSDEFENSLSNSELTPSGRRRKIKTPRKRTDVLDSAVKKVPSENQSIISVQTESYMTSQPDSTQYNRFQSEIEEPGENCNIKVSSEELRNAEEVEYDGVGHSKPESNSEKIVYDTNGQMHEFDFNRSPRSKDYPQEIERVENPERSKELATQEFSQEQTLEDDEKRNPRLLEEIKNQSSSSWLSQECLQQIENADYLENGNHATGMDFNFQKSILEEINSDLSRQNSKRNSPEKGNCTRLENSNKISTNELPQERQFFEKCSPVSFSGQYLPQVEKQEKDVKWGVTQSASQAKAIDSNKNQQNRIIQRGEYYEERSSMSKDLFKNAANVTKNFSPQQYDRTENVQVERDPALDFIPPESNGMLVSCTETNKIRDKENTDTETSVESISITIKRNRHKKSKKHATQVDKKISNDIVSDANESQSSCKSRDYPISNPMTNDYHKKENYHEFVENRNSEVNDTTCGSEILYSSTDSKQNVQNENSDHSSIETSNYSLHILADEVLNPKPKEKKVKKRKRLNDVSQHNTDCESKSKTYEISPEKIQKYNKINKQVLDACNSNEDIEVTSSSMSEDSNKVNKLSIEFNTNQNELNEMEHFKSPDVRNRVKKRKNKKKHSNSSPQFNSSNELRESNDVLEIPSTSQLECVFRSHSLSHSSKNFDGENIDERIHSTIEPADLCENKISTDEVVEEICDNSQVNSFHDKTPNSNKIKHKKSRKEKKRKLSRSNEEVVVETKRSKNVLDGTPESSIKTCDTASREYPISPHKEASLSVKLTPTYHKIFLNDNFPNESPPVYNGNEDDHQYHEIDDRLRSMFQSPSHNQPWNAGYTIDKKNNDTEQTSNENVEVNDTFNESERTQCDTSISSRKVSLGSNEYVIESVGSHTANVFITRKKSKKRTKVAATNV